VGLVLEFQKVLELFSEREFLGEGRTNLTSLNLFIQQVKGGQHKGLFGKKW